MTFKSSILVTLTATLLSSGAYASDLNGSLKDGSSAESGGVVSWTGFYLGSRIGYGHANHDIQVESYQNGAEEIEAVAPLFGVNGLDTSGLTGGGQIGFDMARGRFLFGVFGSYDLSSAETTVSLAGTEIKAIEKGDEFSLGARLGYLVAPRTMAYVLAAYTQSEFSFTGAGDTAGIPNGKTKDVTFDGLTVGGGVEFALTGNVFLGLEGTHTFYGEETIADFHDNEERSRSGIRATDEIGETRIMGTLKVKLNSGLGF